MRTLRTSMKSGQILIIVLLIVVVTLAVGLSVASRNITNLRISTQTEQSQRAFTAAEGGVEEVLSKLNLIATAIGGAVNTSGCSIAGLQATCPISVGSGITQDVKVLASRTYEAPIGLGDVGQIDLRNAYSLGSGTRTLDIMWTRKDANAGEIGSPANPASLEITFVCQPSSPVNCMGNLTAASSGSGYSQNRFAFTSSARTDEAGLTNCGASLAGVYTSATTDPDFNCRVTFTISNNNILFVRTRPLWNRATVRVAGGATMPLPVEIYEVNSQATTETGVARKVQVRRTALPTLPAAFDFALYSESDIVK